MAGYELGREMAASSARGPLRLFWNHCGCQ